MVTADIGRATIIEETHRFSVDIGNRVGLCPPQDCDGPLGLQGQQS
jgi:hypothetical protein